MKKNMINRVHLEGKLYQHKLERKTTGANSKAPGTEYIRGTIEVATDDNVTNIVSVNYTYVTAKYSSGKENPNFKILGDIIDDGFSELQIMILKLKKARCTYEKMPKHINVKFGKYKPATIRQMVSTKINPLCNTKGINESIDYFEANLEKSRIMIVN